MYTDVSTSRVNYITLNQWFDESIIKEDNLQPIYFPSINKKNYENFTQEYFEVYNEYPNQISFLSDQVDHPETDDAIGQRIRHPIDVYRDGVDQAVGILQNQRMIPVLIRQPIALRA